MEGWPKRKLSNPLVHIPVVSFCGDWARPDLKKRIQTFACGPGSQLPERSPTASRGHVHRELELGVYHDWNPDIHLGCGPFTARPKVCPGSQDGARAGDSPECVLQHMGPPGQRQIAVFMQF